MLRIGIEHSHIQLISLIEPTLLVKRHGLAQHVRRFLFHRL
jgi:hypothetical protein